MITNFLGLVLRTHPGFTHYQRRETNWRLTA